MKTIKKIEDFKLIEDKQTKRCQIIKGNKVSSWLSEQIKNMLLGCTKTEFKFYATIML